VGGGGVVACFSKGRKRSARGRQVLRRCELDWCRLGASHSNLSVQGERRGQGIYGRLDLARGLGFGRASVHRTVEATSCPGRTLSRGRRRHLTSGAHLSAVERRRGVTIRGAWLAGPGPFSGLGQLVRLRPFFISLSKTLFVFLLLKPKAFV
jgi:hypothetical protein